MTARARFLAFILATVSASSPAHAADKTQQMTLEDWTEPPRTASMTLSPDGKHVAGIDWEGGLPAAFVTDLDQRKSSFLQRWKPLGHRLYGRWPLAIHWINNDLLALDLSNQESVSVDLAGNLVADLGERFIRPMFEKGASTDSVLVYRDVDDGTLDLVNARSGERVKYRVELPGKMLHGAFDASGALRAVTMMDTAFWSSTTKVSNWYRPDEHSPWQLLEEGPITGDAWHPLRALPEPDSLAILSRRDRDTYAVFRYDTKTRQRMEMMAGHPYEDIVYARGLDQASFESVITDGIKPKISWFDGRWASLQATVDAALPARINILQGDKSGRVLVFSYGDVDPGRWFLLDTQASTLREIGETRRKIDPKQMRPMEIMQYAARDGLQINAYLTRPLRSASGPAPMVVLIHGGPQVRDRWEWNEEVQLLASHGYVVFQPQFRGSTGFGRKFEEAGYRQWGRAMQDDITDGVMHLIERKIADPARICIYGASYGGYAALWGVIKTPDVYQCGVSFAGVSDLDEFVSHSVMDDATAATRELHRALIGDPDQDRARLDEVSPLKHAERVRVPLLIAHGEEDTRVLPSQSEAMVKALRRAGSPVEWMSFENAGHGLVLIRDQQRYYKALLAFFKRHIGQPDAQPPDAAPKAAAVNPQ
jgi:dienelactone hydrolase